MILLTCTLLLHSSVRTRNYGTGTYQTTFLSHVSVRPPREVVIARLTQGVTDKIFVRRGIRMP